MIRLKDFVFGVACGGLAAFALADSTPNLDPVVVSPQLYTVRLDNDRVRVLEYRLKPGGKEALHTHRAGVVISVGDATVNTTAADGTVASHPSHAGDVFWREAVTHSVENVGATEAHYYSVELKDTGH